MNWRRFLGVLLATVVVFSFVSTVTAGPALVFEPKSGVVIYSEDPDAPWHPASLTKLMTAYIVFEELRNKKLKLDDSVTCSGHALKQAPSKIGLPVGAQMSVSKALEALIIKSANDVAVMLAEKVSGSEEAFVVRMNATALRLGMTETHYSNANGLPNDKQITTARDMAILARAIRKKFPQHDHLFSQYRMKLGKRPLHSYNRLLKTFKGADGMKTGFICASGYNVVASATRNNRQIIAVVFGERSGASRTKRAASLLEYGFDTYLWKAAFSTTLDRIAFDNNAKVTPPNLRKLVCSRPVRKKKRRIRRKKRKLRKAKASAKKNHVVVNKAK
jgi:D-alanyl-D-alanine carboxypeptidase